MANWGKIARRTFLVGSAAVAGGVAFGVWQYRRALPNPLEVGAGEVTLNPWIIIDQQGVTLVAARASTWWARSPGLRNSASMCACPV